MKNIEVGDEKHRGGRWKNKKVGQEIKNIEVGDEKHRGGRWKI